MKHILFFTLVVFGLFSCVKEDDKGDGDRQVNQEQFLRNASYIISESYERSKASSLSLTQLAIQLKNSKSQGSDFNNYIPLLRGALKEAWLDWQKISFYEFGAAAQASLKSNVNIYKTDTAKIENKINLGDFDLEKLSMKDAKGFPALDYLLNQKSESETINAFKLDSNRRKFLFEVADDLASRISQINNDWGSSIKQTFESKTGTDVGSSAGMLVNALNQHYEKFFRDNKIGIPLGVRSSGIQRLDFVESAFGQYSVDLAIENFLAMKRFYLGLDVSGNNGYGLDDYLVDLNASDLDQRIKNQMEIIEMKIKGLSNPLANQISSDANKVQEVYNEIQKLIIYWKVDMPSIMGVLITFQDNDGD